MTACANQFLGYWRNFMFYCSSIIILVGQSDVGSF